MTTESVTPTRALTPAEVDALHGIAEGSDTDDEEPLAQETFSYSVGRPWPVDYANPYVTNINAYMHGGQVFHGTMDEAEGFLQYVDRQTGEQNQIYKLVPVIKTVNDKGEAVELVSAEQALRALVGALEVNIPDYGVFEGKRKMVLWNTRSLNSDERMVLCIAENSEQEAHLNHLWGALNQARRTLGIPETEPPSTKAS